MINGFWQGQTPTPALPHHWASNTITYNITGLNADEQFLARSALAAWHDVANINFVETSGAANITFTHNGNMQAVTNASWYGSGAMASATVNISTNWVTTDGGANDGKTGIDSYAYQTYIHEIGHALGLGHQGPYNGSAVLLHQRALGQRHLAIFDHVVFLPGRIIRGAASATWSRRRWRISTRSA